MKHHFLCFFLTLAGTLCFLTPDVGAVTSNQDFTTGQDWIEHMSPREKYMALTPPSILFTEYEVHMKLDLPQYVLLIDKLMERNPRLQDEEVSNIFASTIYLFEPENRPAFRAMELEFLRGDSEDSSLTRPRLTIADVLPENAGVES